MNRREFTTSLAAVFAAPALPLAARTPAIAAPAVPPGAYAWAQLIAQAQNKCSPDMLAKMLHLKPEVAQILFKDLVVDGVLQMPGRTGIAKAANPFDTTGFKNSATQKLKTKAKDALERVLSPEEQGDEAAPLVNPDQPGLGCIQTQSEDETHASPDQSPKEITERR